MQALTATEPEALGFSTDKESLVFNGKTIRGVSATALAWVEKQAQEAARDAVSLILNRMTPASGGEASGSASASLSVRLYLSVGGTGTWGSDQPTGTYTLEGGTDEPLSITQGTQAGFFECAIPAGAAGLSSDGVQRVKIAVTATATSAGMSVPVKWSGEWVAYAPIRTFSASSVVSIAPEAVSGGDKRVSGGIATGGAVTFANVSGQYFVIAVPSGLGELDTDGIKTAEGFGFPMREVGGVSVQLGDAIVLYRCYASADPINDDTVSIVLKAK